MPTNRRKTSKTPSIPATPKVPMPDMTHPAVRLARRIEVVASLTDTPAADVVVHPGAHPILEAAGCKFVVQFDDDSRKAVAEAAATLLMPETLSCHGGPDNLHALVIAEPPRMGVAAMRFSAELVKSGQSGRVLLDTAKVKEIAQAHGGRVHQRRSGATVRFPDGSKIVFTLAGGVYDASELHFPDGCVEYMDDDDAELAPTGATLH